MKIKYNRINTECMFSQLAHSDIFGWGDGIFMVLYYDYDDHYNAVDLETGRLECFDPADRCLKYECTLIVNN